ncbi:MAG: PHP domain-containing protein [Actinomycetota bacterium]
MTLSNRDLAELLWEASEQERDHRRRALRRAGRAAMLWPEEAAAVASAGRSLTELPAVGPWVAHQINAWLEDPPQIPDPPEARRGFLTMSEARAALDADPRWERGVRGDLQVHTTHSDGRYPLEEVVAAAADRGYEYVGITDHSVGLPIANGMSEERLRSQGLEIDLLNARLEADGARIRVLRSIEMNLSPQGEGDMSAASLAELDLVLGAFHSKLRGTEDQTERYLAAVRNPTVHVLAHPTTRRFGSRLGLRADWGRVFEEAARLDKAVEIDCSLARQDLNVELAEIARDAGVRISIGTDAHYLHELDTMDLGLGTAAIAGIAPERVLNLLSADALRDWAAGVRGS